MERTIIIVLLVTLVGLGIFTAGQMDLVQEKEEQVAELERAPQSGSGSEPTIEPITVTGVWSRHEVPEGKCLIFNPYSKLDVRPGSGNRYNTTYMEARSKNGDVVEAKKKIYPLSHTKCRG